MARLGGSNHLDHMASDEFGFLLQGINGETGGLHWHKRSYSFTGLLQTVGSITNFALKSYGVSPTTRHVQIYPDQENPQIL
jgi:hypothetical protein